MFKKYEIIYADPAWSFGDRLRSSKKKADGKMDYRELERHYDTMSIKEMCEIPVKNITAENSVLFMWTTDAHLEEAMKVINAWGFKYKTIGFVWNKKTNKGNQVCFMGKWTMKGSEICLLATKGKAHSMIEKHNVRQLVEAERQKHSKKPDEVLNRIVELLGNRPRLEMFCRESKQGWDVWGNEVDNSITIE
jgi:N6-adenosine-specific RNA methylase IME4